MPKMPLIQIRIRIEIQSCSRIVTTRFHNTAFYPLFIFFSSKVLGDLLSRSKNPYRSVLIMSTLSGDFR
jgi:hypothetical protein